MGPGRHLLEQDLPLAMTGLAAGVAVGLLRRPGGRRWGAGPVIVAVGIALAVSNRTDLPVPGSVAAAVGAVLTLAAMVGAARALAPPAGWEPVAAGALISVGAVWLGVPETGPVAVVAGVVSGLAVTARSTGARWTPWAGAAVAAAVGWAAASGSAGRPWAALGGALCGGVAPWLAVVRVRSTGAVATRPPAPGDPAGPASTGAPNRTGWLLVAHAALALVAARWIAVDPASTWLRVALVAVAGFGVTLAGRRRG